MISTSRSRTPLVAWDGEDVWVDHDEQKLAMVRLKGEAFRCFSTPHHISPIVMWDTKDFQLYFTELEAKPGDAALLRIAEQLQRQDRWTRDYPEILLPVIRSAICPGWIESNEAIVPHLTRGVRVVSSFALTSVGMDFKGQQLPKNAILGRWQPIKGAVLFRENFFFWLSRPEVPAPSFAGYFERGVRLPAFALC